MSHNIEGDLGLYLGSVDAVLIIFGEEPDEGLLLALVEPQLRKARQVAHEFLFYDRAGLGSTEKSFTYLFDAARRTVRRKRAELVHDAIRDASKAAPIKDKARSETRQGGEQGWRCREEEAVF